MTSLPQLRDDQVVLRRPTLDGLPDPCVPEGYVLRPFRPGDEADWQALYDAAFADIRQHVRNKVADLMASDLWVPDRVRFACKLDRPVACALAWEPDWDAPGAGMLHWVAVHPSHRRRGLGRAVVLDALQRMRRTGRSAAVLTTEVYRTAALRLYVDLGFQPDFAAAADTALRWAAAMGDLRRDA
ncbi:MAG: GNAT family N-acetyltransferase [Phycisphaerae bacterium]|nr:GNAT family N-acetyltransferase [Phycisphaerae bacterium]